MAEDKNDVASMDEVTVETLRSMPGLTPLTNFEPAIEEGPHLEDPEIRAAKRAQLKAAGIGLSDKRLTEDMKAILREKE